MEMTLIGRILEDARRDPKAIRRLGRDLGDCLASGKVEHAAGMLEELARAEDEGTSERVAGYRDALRDVIGAVFAEASARDSKSDALAEIARSELRRGVLEALVHHAPRTPGALAKELDKHAEQVSRALVDLVEMGAVQAEPKVPEDRRQRLYRASIRGRKLAAALPPREELSGQLATGLEVASEFYARLIAEGRVNLKDFRAQAVTKVGVLVDRVCDALLSMGRHRQVLKVFPGDVAVEVRDVSEDALAPGGSAPPPWLEHEIAVRDAQGVELMFVRSEGMLDRWQQIVDAVNRRNKELGRKLRLRLVNRIDFVPEETKEFLSRTYDILYTHGFTAQRERAEQEQVVVHARQCEALVTHREDCQASDTLKPFVWVEKLREAAISP
jgi:DNA-binding MarR family transcriptional regulator